MSRPILSLALGLLISSTGSLAQPPTPPSTPLTVLVTGASGQTGRLLYAQLLTTPGVGSVRALVRAGADAESKARAALNCTKCDASEGVFYGDVTQPASLAPAMHGVDTLAITVGVGETANKTTMKGVEFIGVQNQVAALASNGKMPLSSKHVVLLSSMGTTDPHPLPFMGGPVLFWKLNAEAFLGASGIGSCIIKPCGIEGRYGRGGKQLLTGHDDSLQGGFAGAISRADLAAVMVEAIIQRTVGLRFDICIGKGPATTDLAALLEGARYPWMPAQGK